MKTTTKPSRRSNVEPDDDGSLLDKAKGTASKVTSQAREGLERGIDEGKDKAVETFGDVATAVRKTGQKLDAGGPLPRMAERAAEGIDRVARFLDSRDVTDFIGTVDRFARREPALFLGGALAIGLVAGRFLKSSGSGGDDAELGSGPREGDEDDDASAGDASAPFETRELPSGEAGTSAASAESSRTSPGEKAFESPLSSQEQR